MHTSSERSACRLAFKSDNVSTLALRISLSARSYWTVLVTITAAIGVDCFYLDNVLRHLFEFRFKVLLIVY